MLGLETNLALALDSAARSTETLPALLTDEFGRAERLVQLRLRKDAVAPNAAAKPRGEWLLIGKAAGVHRSKFGRKQFRVAAPDSEDDERAGIAYHRRAHCIRQLIGVLVCQAKMRREFARLRKQRCECVGAERLKLINMDEERHALLRRKRPALHRDQLQVRDEERAEKVRRLLPYRSLRQVRDQDAPVVHRERKIEPWSDLAEDEPQVRRGCDLPDLVQDRRDRLRAKRLRVARKFLLPEAQRFGIGHARDDTVAEPIVGVEARQDR